MSGIPFGKMPDGQAVQQFTLSNAKGVEVRVLDYGCTIVSIRVPDRDGRTADVVLGCDTLEGYLANRSYLGCVVGRYGNRIAKGRFTLDGREIQLPAINRAPNHLHGGSRGFDKYVWRAQAGTRETGPGVTFEHTSPDGDEGYPGTFTARVAYTLTDRNELVLDYHATTDKPTILNLTQHTYFNLGGAGSGTIVDHEVMVNADRFTPVDADLIPTGELAPVEGTPFDLRKPTRIATHIDGEHVQLQRGRGFDHNFVLNRSEPGLVHAARMFHPGSGRTLDVHTTEPGMQFYSGNYLDGSLIGKGGAPYVTRSGFCFETQHFPDSPNKPHFPTVVLRPGEEFQSRTVFTFGVRK